MKRRELTIYAVIFLSKRIHSTPGLEATELLVVTMKITPQLILNFDILQHENNLSAAN